MKKKGNIALVFIWPENQRGELDTIHETDYVELFSVDNFGHFAFKMLKVYYVSMMHES